MKKYSSDEVKKVLEIYGRLAFATYNLSYIEHGTNQDGTINSSAIEKVNDLNTKSELTELINDCDSISDEFKDFRFNTLLNSAKGLLKYLH
ncbi:hypothetical protein HN924_01210 [Candidatus Woesearchaeota archaeon]|jgi:hypothetical protein|nr:hypothetical protein [Candidatus Woesearchaeota archaeon]MBT7062567.1 hypothetical protein [Candidatus Woesearchaeota archaeon]MBT7402360.1 hypothetical protein [Candidatus Woesearchaeota archaeon]